MMRPCLFAIPMMLFVVQDVRAQPVSWGMAQCSAMMTVMGGHLSEQPEKSHLIEASKTLLRAAIAQARTEGRDPSELSAVQSVKHDEWVAMGHSMAFETEFRDWTDYCRALARSYDIALDQSMLR